MNLVRQVRSAGLSVRAVRKRKQFSGMSKARLVQNSLYKIYISVNLGLILDEFQPIL